MRSVRLRRRLPRSARNCVRDSWRWNELHTLQVQAYSRSKNKLRNGNRGVSANDSKFPKPNLTRTFGTLHSRGAHEPQRARKHASKDRQGKRWKTQKRPSTSRRPPRSVAQISLFEMPRSRKHLRRRRMPETHPKLLSAKRRHLLKRSMTPSLLRSLPRMQLQLLPPPGKRRSVPS